MRHVVAVAVAASFAAPSSARADTELTAKSIVIVGRAADGEAWRTGATEAIKDDDPRLAIVVVAREGKRTVYVADDDVTPLFVNGRKVKKNQRRSWDALGDAEVQWSVVEPNAWREDGVEAPNGATSRYHSNVSTEKGSFGKWLGYDEITYFETVVRSWSSKATHRQRRASARPPRERDDIYGGLGTIRYKAEVRLDDGTILATPGADATDRAGILPNVHRVSIRRDDTYVGHVTAYFMVPEVFGSAGSGTDHQTERFTGADCADVLTGAKRRAGAKKVWHTNVAGLTTYAKRVAKAIELDADGMPTADVTGVKEGDLIRINYGGELENHTPRSWDHVAVLYEDRSDPDGPKSGGPDGKLDGFDLVVHMGHPMLEVEPLSGQAPATIDVLRWR